jgi:hypothetical protein
VNSACCHGGKKSNRRASAEIRDPRGGMTRPVGPRRQSTIRALVIGDARRDPN